MKTTTILSLILMLVLLAGCGGSSEASNPVSKSQQPTPQVELVSEPDNVSVQPETTQEGTAQQDTTGKGSILNEDYPDAADIRMQLVAGILRLEDSDLAVTPEQAEELIPYWQVTKSLMESGTGSSTETDTVLADIIAEMSVEQLQAIADMQIVRTDMQALAEEWGISTSGMSPGGGMQNLSDDERATRRAERVSQGQSGVGVLLIEQVINILTERSGGTATGNQSAPAPETAPQAAAENPAPVKQDETVAEFIKQGKVSAEWVTSSVLTNDYPDGANIRNQLAWGTLQLEDDLELAVTPDQALQMLRSWRRTNKLVWGGSCSQTEQELLTEIESMMTPEQLQAIVAMKITRQNIKDLAVEWGLDPTMAGKVLSDQELKELRTAKATSNQIGIGMELTRRVVELITVRANS